jgi:hypothetical protein
MRKHAERMDASAFVTDVKSWSDVLANVAQVLAIGIGGWWAYTKFIRQREEWPRVTVEQVVSRRSLSPEQTLLRVAVKAKNDGPVLVEVDDVRVDVYQVLPLGEGVQKALEEGALVPEGATEVSWPCIESRHRHWNVGEVSIEPGESDEFGFDFALPAETKTVFIYCYIRNVMHQEREIGWQVGQFYDLDDGGVSPKRGESLTGKTAIR